MLNIYISHIPKYYSIEMKIYRNEVFVDGPEDVHYTWSHDIPGIYQSNTKTVNIRVRRF